MENKTRDQDSLRREDAKRENKDCSRRPAVENRSFSSTSGCTRVIVSSVAYLGYPAEPFYREMVGGKILPAGLIRFSSDFRPILLDFR